MKRLFSLIALAGLAGCTLGPDYHARAPQPAAAGAFQAGLTVDPAGQLPDRWWSLYNDPALDALVEEALAHNSDLRVAAANLDRARGVLTEQRATLLPTTTTTASANRLRGGNFFNGANSGAGGTGGAGTGTGGNTGGAGGNAGGSGNNAGGTGTGGTGGGGNGVNTASSPINLLRGGFSLAYEVDLFGRVRRSIEAARADVLATEATRDATRVTVAAATTQAYLDACLLGVRVDVGNRSLGILQQAVAGVRRQVQLGVGSPYDVSRQDVLVQQQQAAVNQLDGLRAQTLYDLARLLGRPATEVPQTALACHTVPRLLRPVPIGDGARLIARRPDIRSAERTLAADTARIGVATADLFPTISLGGQIQAAGTSIGNAVSRSGVSYSFGPFLSWFFPNIVAARGRIQQADAQARASLAQFDGTVLTALSEVQRALAAYDAEIRRNASLTQAVADSRRAFELAGVRARLGSISQLELIDVENDLVTTEAALAESDATLGGNQVTLFRTLGGGWQEAPAIDPMPRALTGSPKP